MGPTPNDHGKRGDANNGAETGGSGCCYKIGVPPEREM
jgi:hypothetical protein